MWDEYPSEQEHTPDEALGHVIDALLPSLPPVEQHCVELHFVAGMSYREVAIELGWWEGKDKRRPNKKRAQRTTERGVARLRANLSNGWGKHLAEHRIPK